jgi:hypothetical protein
VTAEDTHGRLSHWGWHPAVLLAELDCELPGRHNARVGQHVMSSGLERCIAGILRSFGDQPLHCRRDACHWEGGGRRRTRCWLRLQLWWRRRAHDSSSACLVVVPNHHLECIVRSYVHGGGIGGCAQHVCFWRRGNKPSGIFRCFGRRARDLHCTCRSCERVTRGRREYGR